MIRIVSIAIAFLMWLALPVTAGEQVFLWQPPVSTSVNDWIWGAGGEARAPQPPFEFLDEDLHGTNPKIRVLDAKDDRWTVKFGGENHSDVFASRLLYAVGYVTEPTYYVSSGTLTGVRGLKRARAFVAADGSFRFARFKLQHSKKVAGVLGLEWSWNHNPFVGTRELNGLKILMMLMSNWDGKDSRDGNGSNTEVYSRPRPTGDQLYYVFDDWGATLGRWGGFFKRDKWNATGFRQQTKSFARSAPRGRIEWGYRGKHGQDITSGISLDDVQWLLTYLSPVTDEELRAGLRASGATEADIQIYARSIRERIAQLQRLAEGEEPASAARGRN